MTLFEQRMAKLRESLKPTENLKGDELNHALKFNNDLMKNNRQGSYLIKYINKLMCLYGIGYCDYTYSGGIGFITGPRRNAQWFTKKEAVELFGKSKTFKIVKR